MRADQRGAIRMGLLLGVALASLLAAVVGFLGYRTNQEVLGIFDRSLDSSREIALDNMSRSARLLASTTAVTVRPSVLDHNYSYIRAVLDDMTGRDDSLLYIGAVDADGSVIEEAGDRKLGARLRTAGRDGLLAGDESVMVTSAAIVSQERTIGTLVLGYSMRPVGQRIEEAQRSSRRERSATLRNLLVGGAVVLIAGIVMAAGFSLWLSRPMSRMAQAAAKLGAGRFDVRVDVDGPHEIRQLAVTFNAMAGALEESVRASNEQAALEREVEIARRLQKDMMPPDTTLRVNRLEIASWYEPADQCGGDWWTLIEDDGGSADTTVMIGDVIGHGIPAALFTAAARGAYRAASALGANTPDQILGTIDQVLRGFAGPHTMSCCAARVGERVIRLAVAGHPPPLRFRRAADATEMMILDAGGPLLGEARAGSTYPAVDYPIEPGDLIVLFTDGLIEACNPADRMFGLRRVQTAIQDLVDRPLDEIVAALKRRLTDHVAGREIDDDVTVVLVRCTRDGA